MKDANQEIIHFCLYSNIKEEQFNIKDTVFCLHRTGTIDQGLLNIKTNTNAAKVTCPKCLDILKSDERELRHLSETMMAELGHWIDRLGEMTHLNTSGMIRSLAASRVDVNEFRNAMRWDG